MTTRRFSKRAKVENANMFKDSQSGPAGGPPCIRSLSNNSASLVQFFPHLLFIVEQILAHSLQFVTTHIVENIGELVTFGVCAGGRIGEIVNSHFWLLSIKVVNKISLKGFPRRPRRAAWCKRFIEVTNLRCLIDSSSRMRASHATDLCWCDQAYSVCMIPCKGKCE